MKFVFILSAVLFFSSPLAASEVTRVSNPAAHLNGKDLINFCKGQYDIDYGYCAGYVAAISDIMLDHAVYGNTACNHGRVAPEQLKELLQAHVKRDPSSQLQPASVATAQALSRAFSCRY